MGYFVILCAAVGKKGIADAVILGEDFIGADRVALILGDNIFYGNGFEQILQSAEQNTAGATVFAYEVRDPERFGVVSLIKPTMPYLWKKNLKPLKAILRLRGYIFTITRLFLMPNN